MQTGAIGGFERRGFRVNEYISTSDNRKMLTASTMKPIQIIRQAQLKDLSDEDGEPITLKLLPGLDKIEIRTFQASLPCPLTDSIQELLGFCRGFEGALADPVDFTGKDIIFEQKDLFPYGLPIAADGFGNFWVVDLTPKSSEFGPIWFACHDAPVILYQSKNISEFLIELFKMCEPPYKSLIDDVHEDRIRNVWRNNPNVLSCEECVNSSDNVLKDFASLLDPTFQVIDLRDARPGDGFSWGRYGPNTIVKRHGYNQVFAYKQKKGLFRRLLRR